MKRKIFQSVIKRISVRKSVVMEYLRVTHGINLINFPKPGLEYQTKYIKSSSKVHIQTCSKCVKCEIMGEKNGVEVTEVFDRSIDDVTKDTYSGSLHFLGENDPPEEIHDPLSCEKFKQINNRINKVLHNYLSNEHDFCSYKL